MANRKLPFGYQMRNGKIEKQPAEAETLRWMFQRYLAGDSYKKITMDLLSQGVSYMPGKCWNKNMVARILADQRYTGADGYPELIDEMLFQAVREVVPGKASPIKRDAERAAVQWFARCGACGARVLRDSYQHGKERWQCPRCKSISTKATDKRLTSETKTVLNQLISDPSTVKYSDHKTVARDDSIQYAEDNFRQMLDAPAFDESAAKGKAISLAAARFDALGSEDYETMRIQYILARAEQNDGLDTELLRQITSAILIHPTGAVSLKLKNGQIMERSNFK